MSAPHTTGPWVVLRLLDGDGYAFYYVINEHGCPLARLQHVAEDRANAILMAAAPDLLEALQLLVQWDECGMALTEELVHKARAAIAKAQAKAKATGSPS